MVDSWITAQHACIATAIIHPECIGKVISSATESDFSDTALVMYRELNKAYRADEKIDPVIINERTNGMYQAYLLDIINNFPALPSMLDSYLEEVHKQSRIVRAQRVMQAVLDDNATLEDIMHAGQQINSITAETTSGSGKSMSVLVDQFSLNLHNKPEYIGTGMSGVDKRLHYRKSNFNIIAARPGIGKTALALQMALHQSNQYKVGYFTLEGSDDELMERIVARVSRVGWSKISDRNLSEADIAGIADALIKLYDNQNFKIYSAAGWSAQEIANAAIADNLDVVYIDYIQLCGASKKGNAISRYEIVTDSSITLRTLANQRHMTVFALAQLNRSGVERPSLQDLRESGQLEQDADTVVFLYRDKDAAVTSRWMEVAKNRHGESGKFELAWDGAIQKFSKIDKVDPQVAIPKKTGKGFSQLPDYVYHVADEEEDLR